MKYYISNNIKFLQGRLGGLVGMPCQAVHMTNQDASQYVKIHHGFVMMLLASKKNKFKYVVSTPQKYVGKEDSLVNSMSDARSFDTPGQAYETLDYLLNSNKFIDNSFITEMHVIDSDFRRIKRPASVVEKQASNMLGKRITLSKGIRRQVVEKSPICAICGMPIKENDVTVDHILPLSRGGGNEIDNLRPVHEACNKLKGNFTDEELINGVMQVACNNLYHSPTSEISARIIRSIVRGTLAGCCNFEGEYV